MLAPSKPRIDLNASSAERWVSCTASPKFIFEQWANLPDQDKSFADEGTSAHEVAAAMLQVRQPNPTACPVPVDATMRLHAWDYMEFVQGQRKPGSTLLVEQKLPLFYHKTRNAIVDAAVINSDRLDITDFKYGVGIQVSPENNLQAITYAKSLVWHRKMALPPNFPISIHIYQPRGRGAENPVKSWHTDWQTIEEQSHAIFHVASDILSHFEGPQPSPRPLEFAPSEKACQWCPAKALCPARREKLANHIKPVARMDRLPAVQTITVEQIKSVLMHGDDLIKWVGDVKQLAQQMLARGDTVPGFKLVMSKGGHRYWTNPQQAAKLMLKNTVLREDEVVKKSTISPAQFEQLAGKARLSTALTDLIARPVGQPVIAPEDDPRPSIGVNLRAELEDDASSQLDKI